MALVAGERAMATVTAVHFPFLRYEYAVLKGSLYGCAGYNGYLREKKLNIPASFILRFFSQR